MSAPLPKCSGVLIQTGSDRQLAASGRQDDRCHPSPQQHSDGEEAPAKCAKCTHCHTAHTDIKKQKIKVRSFCVRVFNMLDYSSMGEGR